ncbi:MAG: methyltransferase [Gracilibacter sp. BRH_c7a]|nr:MAG: methyltransferase [Gracilibacter sp. BRH_c7a]
MTKQIFDDVAVQYDEWYENPIGRAVDYVERRALEELFRPQGNKILEIGCGTGLYTVRMAANNYNVTALDISSEMMKIAQAKVQSIGKEVKWILGDISKMLDSLETYDGIFSMTALEFIHQPQMVLQALYQKLNPGGCLVIGVIADNSTWSEVYRQAAQQDPESVFQSAHFFTEKEIRAWNIGNEPEIRKVLFFSPETMSYEEAMEQENKAQGNPGFLVANWRK